jgi:hypothetical protein
MVVDGSYDVSAQEVLEPQRPPSVHQEFGLCLVQCGRHTKQSTLCSYDYAASQQWGEILPYVLVKICMFCDIGDKCPSTPSAGELHTRGLRRVGFYLPDKNSHRLFIFMYLYLLCTYDPPMDERKAPSCRDVNLVQDLAHSHMQFCSIYYVLRKVAVRRRITPRGSR